MTMTRQRIETAIEQIERDEFRLPDWYDNSVDLASVARDVAPDLTPRIRALELAKRHEIFERVKAHLLAQGERSMKDQLGCAYRGKNGTKCAIGCLISDEEYDPFTEGEGAHMLVGRDRTLERYAWSPRIISDLFALQSIHDLKQPHHWPGLLDAHGRHLSTMAGRGW